MANARIGKQYYKQERILNYVEHSISQTRQDIRSWKQALAMAQNADEPRNWKLQLLYEEISQDALLFSQIQNRREQVLSIDFDLVNADGTVNEEQTRLLRTKSSYRQILLHLLNSIYYGYSLIELEVEELKSGQKDFKVELLPRTNIVPKTGLFYPDYFDGKAIPYRNMQEYGSYILEFDRKDVGLLNKAVPHVLFKRFAASCWSELCEIYGIPPRVMKTNTADPRQLAKAQRMMEDMGAAAYFIIDRSEEFEWAEGVSTSGDVYDNLINLCNNEISMLISGAIIGQDTKYGSEAKDVASQDMLWQLVQSDMHLAEDAFNNIILPAYAESGLLNPGLTFQFGQSEDIAQLFKFTQGLLPFKEVDDEWLKEKFGVEVVGNRQFGMGLSNPEAFHDFFD